MTTKEIINKALEVMNGQDWYWFMSDYQVAEMRDKAYGTMRYYVELVASEIRLMAQCVITLNWLLLSAMQRLEKP